MLTESRWDTVALYAELESDPHPPSFRRKPKSPTLLGGEHMGNGQTCHLENSNNQR
jgi:hypothetical protein